jgi:hypothetical protein
LYNKIYIYIYIVVCAGEQENCECWNCRPHMHIWGRGQAYFKSMNICSQKLV